MDGIILNFMGNESHVSISLVGKYLYVMIFTFFRYVLSSTFDILWQYMKNMPGTKEEIYARGVYYKKA